MKPPVIRLSLLLALLSLFIVACAAPSAGTVSSVSSFPKNEAGYAEITVQQLNALLPQKDFTLVNVRGPDDGMFPETDLVIPFADLAASLDKLPAKDAPIVLYCLTGKTSEAAAETLVAAGYTNVVEVDGGIDAWKAAGYALLTAP